MALSKCTLSPTQSLRFLGYLSNSVLQAFILPEDKKAKFITLRESILSLDSVDLKTLQRFAGKTTSFSIAVPAARLYTRGVFRAIARHTKQPNRLLRLTPELRNEIAFWRFLDNWQGHLPWHDERHIVVSFYADASNSGWGAVVLPHNGTPITLRDYWQPNQIGQPIMVKEALALLNALSAVAPSLVNSRVDARTDNSALLHVWANQGGKHSLVNAIIKSIFQLTLRHNISLTRCHSPSKGKLADAPSRVLSAADCMLANCFWVSLEVRWGPHSVDLMALDSNVHNGGDGKPLRHFSPWPTPGSDGVNIFAQYLSPSINAYVFPPIPLIGPVLRFLKSSGCRFTLVVPDLFPRRFWWPLVNSQALDKIRLGSVSQVDVLLFPSRAGVFTTRPLPWDLWAFRLDYSHVNPCTSDNLPPS